MNPSYQPIPPFTQPFCQQLDVGVRLLLTIVDQDGNPVDISTATSLVIKIEYPDQTSVDKTGTLYSDGTDGVLYYDTIANDLSQSGQYFCQAKVTIASQPKSSAVGPFFVYPNIDGN